MNRDHKNKLLLTAAILLAVCPQPVMAQTAAPTPDTHTETLLMVLYLVVGAVMLGAVITLSKLATGLLDKMRIDMQKANGTYVEPVAQDDVVEKFINSFKKSMSDAVPIEQEASIDLGHNYDGIRELDNNLPPWWIAMFYASIIFAVGYIYYYHMGGGGVSIEDAYIAEVEDARIANLEYLAKQANKVDENSVTLLADAGSIESGKNLYTANCATCHGANGEGNVGPNFTDEFWIHGGGIHNVFKTIKYGVPAKGMISWEAQLSPVKMQQVASYILSLKGTNPANAKAPQGDVWVETADSTAIVVDTTTTAKVDTTTATVMK
jgi:cytochrome c oxidase cbb3-type subunit III